MRLLSTIVNILISLIDSQPDISFVVSVVSQFMQVPRESQWNVAKRIKDTYQLGIIYCTNTTDSLVVYTESDWARDGDNRKLTFGYVFLLGLVM